MGLKSKRLLSVSLIIALLLTMLPFKSIQAETVYLGGSQNIAIGGSPGNHSILLAPDFPMALRVSIQVQKPGDFAEQGYENSYPISQYSLVLVPPGTPNVAKTKTVLASKGGGTCDYVCGIALFPLMDIQTKPPKLFNQNLCNYTEKGRRLIHDNLIYINPNVIKYLLVNPEPYSSTQFNDNRLSLYAAQKGLCGISGEILKI